ncbi:MAG TPA: ABC transporter substrate-binding protein [Gaiellaceae bacterium]|nr:ABC transporter substrate-binding protein [Gaiellaceae bacterium]
MLRRSLVLAALLALAAVFASASPAAVPHRIVSLSPTATETLFAIGAGKQVVAVDNDSTYPAQAPRTKLSGVTPNVEAIAAYRPDLVVIAYDPGGLAAALAKLKIPVLDQDAAKNFAGAYAQIRRLGAVTGHRAGAAGLVARMKARIAKAVASAHDRGRGLTVYHELDPTLYSVTSNTFAGQVYRLFGLKDIADAADKTGSGYPQLSAEYVVASDPDLIVLADTVCCGQSRASVASRPGWSGIRAVRDGEVVRLDDSIASRWGPRIVDFVRAIASALRHLPAGR